MRFRYSWLLLGNLVLAQVTLNITALEFTTANIEEKNSISIEADFVNYSESNDNVKATGNVLLVYKDYRMTANQSLVNMKTDQVYLSEGFIFKRANQMISGETMSYDFTKEEGYATKVDVKVQDSIIKGKNVVIKKDKVQIDDAWQTTCKKGSACHHITAKRITIYPEWGDIVADHAVIYAWYIPLMYLPNYIVDSNDSFTSMMSSAIPRFGSNLVEGNFAKAGISYYKNEKANGTVDIHLLSKLGARFGFTNNYKLNQSQRGQVRLHYLTGLGGRTSYGWQHRFLMGVPDKNRSQIIEDFFKGVFPPSNQTYPEVILDISDREMLNYQWVSYKPKLSLITPQYEFFIPEFYHYFGAHSALIREEDVDVPGIDYEGVRNIAKGYWDYNIYRRYSLGEYGQLIPSITYMKTGYYEGNCLRGAWKRFYYNFRYLKNWEKFEFGAGYKNTFAESGFSPLKFDSFNVSTPEETNFSLGYQVLDWLKLKYGQDYSITDHELRDKYYSAIFKVCCWNIDVSWADHEARFNFGISLE